MIYKFENKRKNYSAFASGSVLKSFPGQPAFPVRLASELFQRSTEILNRAGINLPYTLYDPFSGSGYLITSLGFIHGNSLSKIFGSDIELETVNTANDNLNLLTEAGLKRRNSELQKLYNQFEKKSYLDAIKNAEYLAEKYLSSHLQSIPKQVFQADAFNKLSIEKYISLNSIDIVITDVPYGNQTEWVVPNDLLSNGNSHVNLFLNTIKHFMKPKGLVVLTSQSQRISIVDDWFQKHHFKVGHRHVYFFQFST